MVHRWEIFISKHDQREGVVVAGRWDVVSTLACARGDDRPVGREKKEVLEPQRALPVEEEFRGEEAKVVAGRREIEALVRPVLQEGTTNELGRAVVEGEQDVLRGSLLKRPSYP